jgi:hypothetical protein
MPKNKLRNPLNIEIYVSEILKMIKKIKNHLLIKKARKTPRN